MQGYTRMSAAGSTVAAAPDRPGAPQGAPLGAPSRAGRRQFWVALLCVGVAGAGNSAGAAVFPPLARELHISEATVGVLSGLAPLVFMLTAPVWGHMADRAGARIVLAVGMLGYAIGAAAFVFSAVAGLGLWMSGAAVIGALAAGRVVNGALGAGTYPAAVSTAAAVVPVERRSGAIASISAAYGIGTMLGPAVATLLASTSLYAPHLVLAGVSLAAASLVLLTSAPAGAAGPRKPGRIVRPTDARIRPFLVVTGATYAIVAELGVVLGFSIQDGLRLDAVAAAEVTGLMFTMLGLSSLAGQLVLTRLRAVAPVHAMRAGIGLLLAGLVGLALAGGTVAFGLACAAVGLGIGLSGPTTSAACSLAIASEEQGSGAGWMSSARSVGAILGAWSGGLLYTLGPQLPYVACSTVALGIAALVAFHPRMRARR